MRVVTTTIAPERLRLDARTGAERAVQAVGRSARDAAAERLARDLGGYDLDTALAQSSDDAVMALLQLDAGFAEALGREATWDRYVAEHEASHPYFARATADQGSVPVWPDVYREPVASGDVERPWILPGGLAAALSSGETYIIHRLDQYDRGVLGRFVEDLEHLFGFLVSVNCYLSRDRATGFGSHWDDHHVLVLQVRGRKLWEVFQPTQLSPLRPFVTDDAAGAPVWSGVLSPGQALVIPQGWAHRVVGLDELSVHYTVALSGTTVRHLLSVLDDPPRAGGQDDLRRWLVERTADSSRLVERALGYERARLPGRARSGVEVIETWRAAGADPAGMRVLMPGGAVFHGDPPDDGEVELGWANCVVRLTADDVEALTRLPGSTVATGGLCDGLLRIGAARIEAA
jgi:hypothetical protein